MWSLIAAISDEAIYTSTSVLSLVIPSTPIWLWQSDLKTKLKMEAKVQGHNMSQLLRWNLSPTFQKGPTSLIQVIWCSISQWEAEQPAVCHGCAPEWQAYQCSGWGSAIKPLNYTAASCLHHIAYSALPSSGRKKSHIVGFFLLATLQSKWLDSNPLPVHRPAPMDMLLQGSNSSKKRGGTCEESIKLTEVVKELCLLNHIYILIHSDAGNNLKASRQQL